MQSLFLPFCLYLVSFSYYVTYVRKGYQNDFTAVYCVEWASLVISAKCLIHFIMLESIQFSKERIAYFTDFWNLLDLTSMLINITYTYAEIMHSFEEETINLLGAIGLIIMWTKMFYWMRILKPFAAFIRVVTGIVKHIGVFSVMLIMVLVAFANCLTVLELNRHSHSKHERYHPPIFDDHTSLHFFDAMIHSYLTGLGDFNSDNYSEKDALEVWIFFLVATFIV